MKKNKRLKIGISVLILALLLSTVSAFAAVPDDVKGKSYEQAVEALMEKGIITGDTDGSFNPDSNLTRAQACIIIVKSMNPSSAEVAGTATQPAQKSGFGDMSGYGWAEGYINYAVKNGVTKGYPDGTFKPGNSVTMNELVTMVLRAAGYQDEDLQGIWPENYMNKAAEMELLKGTPDTLPTYATKWIAAQVDFNALEAIAKANPDKETPDTDQQPASNVPDTASMTYVKGSFNDNMTTYNGRELADNVVIYTFGAEKDYKTSMTFSTKAADYKLSSVYKYKNVETPAFYKLDGNKIVAMVVPGDVGFSGYAYVVINGTLTMKNADGDSVNGLNVLAAANELKWAGKKGLTVPAKTGSASYLNGTVYELHMKKGEIQSILTAETHKGKYFEEFTGGSFETIQSYKNGVVELESGELWEIQDNATVYTIDADDAKEYKVGKQSNIKKGNEIRIYDIKDDDKDVGNIIVVRAK